MSFHKRLFLTLLVAYFSHGANVRGAERPNILVLFIDDMGWRDLSAFGGGITRTDNIDRLASEGLRFTNFYVNAPLCSPSRVALSTCRYPQRWRIDSYLADRQLNERRSMAQWLDSRSRCGAARGRCTKEGSARRSSSGHRA